MALCFYFSISTVNHQLLKEEDVLFRLISMGPSAVMNITDNVPYIGKVIL